MSSIVMGPSSVTFTNFNPNPTINVLNDFCILMSCLSGFKVVKI